MIDGLSLDLVVEAAWKSALMAGAALLLLTLLRKRSAAERACVAHFGMAAVLLVPLLVVAAPNLEVELLAAEPMAAVAAPVTPLAVSEGAADIDAAFSGVAAASPGVSAPAAVTGAEFGLLIYLAPAALLLFLTLVAVMRLFALRGRADVIVEQNWLTALAHAQRRMGIKSGTALLASRELKSPVSWGLLRPIILLSEDALDNRQDAEAIIAHELAHVVRSDWLNLLIARVATALFWFNPLVWLLARQGNQLREEAADDAVLCADVPCTDYAALLVGAARHENKGLLLAANGVAPRKGSLSLRVHRILEPTSRRAPARLAWGSGCAAGALLVAAPLAALTPVAPPAPETPLPPTVLIAAAPLSAAPSAPPMIPGMSAVAPSAPSLPPTPVAAAAAVAPALPAAAPAAPSVPATPAPPSQVGAPIPPATLVAMRAHNVTSETLAEYAAAYPRLRNATVDQLISLRVHNVTPQRLRQYAALGYGNLDCNRLVEWTVQGVTPAFIQSIAREGYANLRPSQLTAFRVMGVSAEYIRDIKEAGLSLSPERLVELRTHGSVPLPGPSPRPPNPPRPGRGATD